MADFKVPQVDFSWLGQLPAEYELGKKSAQQRGLSEDLANFSLKKPDGTTDFPSLAKIYAKHGFGEEAVQLLARQPMLTPDELLRHEDTKAKMDWEKNKILAEKPWLADQLGQPTQPGDQTAQTTAQPHPMSESEAARDKKYATGDYLTWVQGGQSEAQHNIASLEHATALLKQHPELFGSGVAGNVVGIQVKKALSGKEDQYTIAARQMYPEAFNVAAAHQRAVVASLRPLIGARAAQQLFQSVMSATYDPAAGPEENFRRLDMVLDNIKAAAKNKQGMADWYSANHTLSGFPGTKFDPDSFDPLSGVDAQPTKQDSGSKTPPTQEAPLNVPTVPGARNLEVNQAPNARYITKDNPQGQPPTPEMKQYLQQHKNDPKALATFDRYYGEGTSNWILTDGQ